MLARNTISILLSLTVALGVLALSACAQPAPAPKPPATPAAPAPAASPAAPAPAPTPTPAPAFKWPDMITIAGGPAEAAGYAAAVAWTSALAKDTGANIRVVPSEMSPVTWRSVQNGTYLAFADAPVSLVNLVQAAGGFATKEGGPFAIRSMWQSSKTVTGYIVRGDFPASTPADLKPGIKVGYLSTAPIGKMAMLALLAWANLKEDQVEWVPAPDWAPMWKDLTNGKTDVCFAMPSAPGVQEAEATPKSIKWLQLDPAAQPDGANRFLNVLPQFAFGVNTSGAKSSIGMKGLATISSWVTREQTDTELIYRISKWLGENFNKYQGLNPYLATYGIDVTMEMVNTSYIPAHPGLVKYLKEAGKWTAKNDARQAENVALIQKYIDAYQKAVKEAESKGIPIDPTNKAWSDFWTNYQKEQKLPVPRCFPGL